MRMREGHWVIGDWLDFAWALGDPPEDQRAYNIIWYCLWNVACEICDWDFWVLQGTRQRDHGGRGRGLLIRSQTPRVIARLAAGSVKGKTQHKANEKNVNIAAPVADYGLCLSWSQPVNMPPLMNILANIASGSSWVLVKFFFRSTMKTKEEKKRCLWPLYAISPLSLSQTLRRDTYTNSRKLQTISMFHHTRALSNNSPCNLNVIYPPGWTQSHHSPYPLHPSENCPFSRPYISIPFGNGLEE